MPENLEEVDYRAYLDFKPAYSPENVSSSDKESEESPMEKRFIKDDEDSDKFFFVIEDNPHVTYMDRFIDQQIQASDLQQNSSEPSDVQKPASLLAA